MGVHCVGGRVHDDAAVEDEGCRWRSVWDAVEVVIEEDVACIVVPRWCQVKDGYAARCAWFSVGLRA